MNLTPYELVDQILKKTDKPIDLNELLARYRKYPREDFPTSQLNPVVWQLVGDDRIEFTDDWKLVHLSDTP